jgi:hypothetical protein
MKYFAGFLATVGLIVVVIILVVRGFSGGDGSTKRAIDLARYENSSAQVELVVEGPINSDSAHVGYSILVDRDVVTMKTFKGYEQDTVDIYNFDNNSTAYGVFLRALDLQGYTRGDDNPDKQDSRGYCPNGKRYTFKIIGDDAKQNYWSTSCGKGNFKGNRTAVLDLFARQVPNYEQVAGALNI